MAESVLKDNEISLNGVRYPIEGQVQRSLSSIFPQKQVIGEWTQGSDPNLNTLVLGDHRGGIGMDVMRGAEDIDRSWYSTATLRYKNRLFLPPLPTVTSNLPAGVEAFAAPVSFKGSLYVYINATNPGIYAYTDSTTTWGSRLQATLAVTDGVAGNIGGTYTLVFTDGTNLHYSTDGAAWSSVAVGATYLIIWDDKLFCVNSAGQMFYYTAMGGTLVNDAKIILGRIAELTELMIGPNAQGDDIIYAVTSHGLYAHDFGNGKFILTRMKVENKTTSSYTALACGCTWRGLIYYSSESTLYEYDPIGGTPIHVVGPDRDGGVPNGGGLIASLQPSFNELVALICGNAGSLSTFLAGWDGQGWQVLVEPGVTSGQQLTIKVSGAYGDYRLWYFDDGRNTATYLKIPADLINPLRNTSFTYAASATHDWPWFVPNYPAVAVRLHVETINPTADETVIISYATNMVETFTALTTITTTGETVFLLPNSTTPTGIALRSIRFRAALARGSTNTNTPQVIKVTLKYFERLAEKYQFIVTLDMDKGYGSRSAKELQAALLTAQETDTLVEFTYRDSSSDADATFYVQVRPVVAAQNTGRDYGGKAQLLLVQM